MMQNLFADIGAEKAIIGAVLQDTSVQNVLDELPVEAFTSPLYSLAWQTAKELRQRHSAVDLVTVGAQIPNASAEMIEAMRSVPTTANLKHYVKIVQEKYRRRMVRTVLDEALQTLIQDGGETATDDCIDRALNAFRGFSGDDAAWLSAKDVAYRSFDMLEDIAAGKLRSIPTPLPNLNAAMAGGLRQGEVTVLAAVTGGGKSALALEIAKHAAKSGYSVGVISREMSAEQYGLRAFSSVCGLSTGEMLAAKKLKPEHWEAIANAVTELQGLPIHFSFSSSTVEDVRRNAQRLKKLDLLIVDYIQILGTKHDYASEHLKISHISRQLKEMAMDFHIPVLALSQFKRLVGNRKPALSDLKESGSLENDADNVWLIYRPADDEDENIPPQYAGWVTAAEQLGGRFLLLEVAKQRMYSPGTVAMYFDPARMKFSPPEVSQ